MANYNKNIFVGTGGSIGIHRSHFLGAVYGMERMMGRADTPVRRVLNYASDHFAKNLPIVYVQTVVGKNDAGKLVIRGLYIGDDAECFELAAALSLKVNFKMMDREIKKAVVFLDPHEFKSTWLGNKSVYRTRMALADNAELIVLAPGVHEFGEDAAIDVLIRKYGYCGTPRTLEAVKEDPQLAGNLSAAAHLIHGSSEGRFTIRYCPGHLTRQEIESAHFEYGDLADHDSQIQSRQTKRRLEHRRRRRDLLHLQPRPGSLGLQGPLRPITQPASQRNKTITNKRNLPSTPHTRYSGTARNWLDQ